MILQRTPSAQTAVLLDDIRAHLRLDDSLEDAALATWLRVATVQAETYLGCVLLPARFEQRGETCPSGRIVLGKTPVIGVVAVEVDGSVLNAADFELASGGVVILASPAARATRVVFDAGRYPEPNAIPEPIRFGITRQVVHLFTHRDAPDVPLFPPAVLAAWQPWRPLALV